jgi:hypothetical protein
MRVPFSRLFSQISPRRVRTRVRVSIGGEVLSRATELDRSSAAGGTPLAVLWGRDLEVVRANGSYRVVGAY